MRKDTLIVSLLGLSMLAPAAASAQQKRGLTADDIYNIKDVRDPQRSPDGMWVAYVVARAF